jgi:hypothetical protein
LIAPCVAERHQALHPNRSLPVRTLANEVFLRIRDAYQAVETSEGETL